MPPNDNPNPALGPTLIQVSPDSDDPQALVGQVIAERYEVEALLGVGGMGSVYRARHIKIRKQVALKTLHAALLRSPEAVARFEREAVAAARINHPNVIVATDFGPLADGRYYLVLEYVDGCDLAQAISAEGAMTVSRTIAIARQIACALDAAHSLGIVHRDLKPDNVMLVRRGVDEQVKVLDFGIAKVTLDDNAQQLTQFGAVFGTPQYMSPEQAKGQSVDGRSDLYSLGVVMYEMLTGKLPFEATDALGFLMQHLNAEPTPLPRSIPEPVRKLVHLLLAKDPAQRYQTAATVLAEFDKINQRPSVERSQRTERLHRRITRVATSFVATLGRTLKHPRRLGKYTFPTAGWLTVFALPTISVVLLAYRCAPIEATADNHLKLIAAAPAPSSALPTMSQEGFAAEVARIEPIKVYERTELDWMILARGNAQLSRFEESVGAYQALLSLRRDLRKDPGLLTDLLNASQDPKAFRVVLNLAETILGKHGVDLIWEMWQQERYNPERKEQADKLAKKLVILSRRASPALRIAIELTFTTQCDKLLGVLERAPTDADNRSSERLATLFAHKGCGTDAAEDCFPCLRDNPLLEQAIARAQKTAAPRLGETTED